MIEEYGQDAIIYKRLADPELYDGQHISDMLVYACQCRVMIEKEQWSTGTKRINDVVLGELSDWPPNRKVYIRYAYDENDDPTALAILEIRIEHP